MCLILFWTWNWAFVLYPYSWLEPTLWCSSSQQRWWLISKCRELFPDQMEVWHLTHLIFHFKTFTWLYKRCVCSKTNKNDQYVILPFTLCDQKSVFVFVIRTFKAEYLWLVRSDNDAFGMWQSQTSGYVQYCGTISSLL